MATDDRNVNDLALGEAFLAGVGSTLSGRMRGFDAPADDVAAWTSLVGVMDRDALARLHALRLGCDTLTALVLVPVLNIAWCSPEDVEGKRRAMGETAVALGLSAGDPGHDLLLRSLVSSSAAQIMTRWKRLLQELVDTVEPRGLAALQWELMDRAWLMAAALHGSDASLWPREVFAALTELEGAFYDSGGHGAPV